MRLKFFAGSVLFLTVLAGLASASLVIQIDTGNGSLTPPFTGPFATVTVNLIDPTHASFSFVGDTSNSGPGSDQYLMGGQGAVGLNINAASFAVVGGVAGVAELNSLAGFTPGPATNIGAGNEDGFGNFNLSIDNFDGFSHSATSIGFIVQNTSGTWSSVSNVLTANGGGFEAAAHIYVESPNCTGACTTGFATNSGGGTTASTPEPMSMILTGAGLVGVALVARKRKQKLN